jgi:predicted alpha/beta-fold hydrolase
LAGKFLRPERELPVSRERWDTPDGDFLDVDLLPDTGGPVVLILHGLEGHTRRPYVRNCFHALREAGLVPVGLNFRACSGEPNRRIRTYHSGETGDLGFVLGRLRERFPNRALGVIGVSLGGNVLLKYLGERGAGHTPPDAPGPLPDAAVTISVPFDLAAGADLLSRTRMGRVYTHYFLRSLVGKVLQKETLLADRIDLEALRRVRSLRAFDNLVTAPLNGFHNADHYYRESSSAFYLEGVRTPTLVLQAEDDPFLPRPALPEAALRANPSIHLALTDRGGHVGFVGGTLRRPRFWAEESSTRFLRVVLAGSSSVP